ncbi:MAG: LysR substrate-binding domain-containing protein [Steroidobacteraceae bacterium]
MRPVTGLPNLAWLRSFEAAARTSSFAAAAKELRLTAGAISYQIRALESHLGFGLFERLPRGVKLTAMGVAYLPPVRKAFDELADSTVGLFGGSERTQVSVHAPVSLAALWLAPMLPVFSAAHPAVDIRLSSVIWDNAVPDETTDLEVRYGTGHWHGYRSEHLLNQSIMAACSPRVLAAARTVDGAAQLLPTHLIPIMGYENHWLKVRHGLGLDHVALRPGPTVDTTLAALELAASGAGCALAHRIFLKAYFASGRLVAALDRQFADDNSYFVLTPERPQRPRREVQVFRDWLISTAALDA